MGPVIFTASFLYLCSGYYNYDAGFTPEFPGLEDFEGEVVHPQFWTDDVDYDDKEVVVIGSGATAVTLIPSMADRTKHVTMLQRSPTYITSLPQGDPIASGLRKVLPLGLAHRLTRRKNAAIAIGFYVFSQRFPKLARRFLIGRARRALPDDFDVKHLKPKYNPWDQRLCIVPNGDLWRTLKSGKASIATDQIARFTEDRHRPGVRRPPPRRPGRSPPPACRWWRSARSPSRSTGARSTPTRRTSTRA